MLERFHRFSYAIFAITRCWHRLAAEEMAAYGLKGPHALYLCTLLDQPEGMTAAQLCQQTGRDKGDVSRALSLLEKKGLICREGDSGYRACVRLTDQGEAAACQVSDVAARAVEQAGRDISPQDRETFYSALYSITAQLQTMTQKGTKERL